MDNINTLFYTGQQNPYGIGTWDSRGPKLKHSSSLPYYTNSKTLPPILQEQKMRKNTQYSKDSNNIKLPIIHSRPSSYHRHKNVKKYKTNSSSESLSYQFDANKNRKELCLFVYRGWYGKI